MQKLYFSLDQNTHVKLRFYIEDENRNLLYEGKMVKHNLIGPHTYLFIDHVNHKEELHKAIISYQGRNRRFGGLKEDKK